MTPTVAEPEFARGVEIILGYFRKLKRILLDPTGFFRELPVQGGLGAAFGFGLISHWLGEAFAFFWQTFTGAGMLGLYERFRTYLSVQMDLGDLGGRLFPDPDPIVRWVMEGGRVLLDPFSTLLQTALQAMLLLLVAKLLVRDPDSRTRVTWETFAKLLCYAMAAAPIQAIPLVGWAIAKLWGWVVLAIGIQQVLKVGTGRAVLIALSPDLILAIIVLFIIFALLATGIFLMTLSI
jgi:hypothetical protein